MSFVLEQSINAEDVRRWCETALPGLRVLLVPDALDDISAWASYDVVLSLEPLPAGGHHLQDWKTPWPDATAERDRVRFALALCAAGAPSVLVLSGAMLASHSPYYSLRVTMDAAMVVDDSLVDAVDAADCQAPEQRAGGAGLGEDGARWDLGGLRDVGELDRSELEAWTRGERGPLAVPERATGSRA